MVKACRERKRKGRNVVDGHAPQSVIRVVRDGAMRDAPAIVASRFVFKITDAFGNAIIYLILSHK
jgi:hypothetical protein